jgi:putative SOS response-associated peptidase YedK
LIPSWAKDRKLSFKMINARSETAAVKPAFRGPFKKKRCLVPADGYYEWIMTENGKLPYAIYPSDEDTFYMAGLWDCWKSPEGLMVLSFTILTRAADPQVEHLHHRMPVILDDQTQEAWIDPNLQDPQELESLLDYTKPTDLRFHPISTLVNSVRNNGPELIEPRS